MRILTSEDSESITLDATGAKNWHIDMLHISATVNFVNILNGRRGHVVVDNRREQGDVALSYLNANVVTNGTWPLIISQGQTAVIRYYGDLDSLILEVM